MTKEQKFITFVQTRATLAAMRTSIRETTPGQVVAPAPGDLALGILRNAFKVEEHEIPEDVDLASFVFVGYCHGGVDLGKNPDPKLSHFLDYLRRTFAAGK